jgi:hypothetical protein
MFTTQRSWWVCVAHSVQIRYSLDDRGIGFQVLIEARFFSSPLRVDWLCDLPSLIYNGYWGLFP